MNNLEIINNTNEELSMSSREIAKLTKKRHSDVMRDIRYTLYCLNIEQNAFLRFDNTGAKRRRIEYFLLSKELTLTLVSGYSARMRNTIIKRWLELEKTNTLHAPATMTEALELALAQSKQLEAQKTYIDKTKDDVDFAQTVTSSKEGVLLEDFSKAVGIGRNQLFRWLRKAGILMEDRRTQFSVIHNVPYQQYINAGYFDVQRRTFATNHGQERGNTTLITGKGEKWLTKRLINAGLIPSNPPLTY